MPKAVTYYEVLGVPPSAAPEEITQAYRRLARTYHPDLQPPDLQAWANECMQTINAAYEVLSDPIKKAHYDAMLFPPAPPSVSADPSMPNITAYNFRLTDRAARRIINILLVASVALFVVSQLPTSAQSETYGQAPVLQVLVLYMLFRLRDSNALKDRIPLILGTFVFVGGLFMAATATAITQATSAGQNKFSIEVVIWVITCLWACTILIRHFKVEPP